MKHDEFQVKGHRFGNEVRALLRVNLRGAFLLYRKVLLSENLGTKIARSKAGIVNQTVWIKRCKSPLHQNRHHQGYQIHVRNNPYPEVRRHSCHGLL